MLRKFMIIPNVLLLACAVFLFHRIFISGRVSGIGTAIVLSAALPLAYCFIGKMWLFLKAGAALLNLVLFGLCGYVFLGTVNVLLKANMAGPWFYIILIAIWAAALLGAYFLRKNDKKGLWAGFGLNAVLCAVAAAGLYYRISPAVRWQPWMNAVLFGIIMAVTALNIYMLLSSVKRAINRPASYEVDS